KLEVETMSINDLYNNFKIVEQKVKKTVGTSSGGQNLAFMTAPSSSSTNDANTAYSQVSAASPSVNTASLQVCTANVSDNTMYAFMVENPNGSNVLHQDLEKIHEDDLEAIDLKAPRSKENQFRNQDNTRKQGNKEDTSKAMLAIDGGGFDWSDMAEEQVQINMTLIAFSDSQVYTDKTCLNNYKTLKKQYDDLLAKQHQTKFEAATYKIGLDTVEAQLVTYRKNEVLFSEEVIVLKREVGIKQYEINTLKTEFEKLKQEKDAIDFKIKKFDKASKDLDQLLESQITDKSKKGLGYSAIPLPHPLIYNRPKKLDLSYSGLDEFKEPKFKGYGPENSKKESNVVCENESNNSKENSDKSLVKEQESQVKSSFVEGCGSNTSKSVSEVEPKKVRENNDAPIIEEWVSDDEEQDESKTKPEKKTVVPTIPKVDVARPKEQEKPVRKIVRYAKMCRSQKPRGNQRNCHNQKSQQLGSDFVMNNKASFVCGSFDHLKKDCGKRIIKPVWKNTRRVNDHYSTRMTYSNPRRNMIPQAVLMRSRIKAVNTAKPKDAHNAVKRNRFNTIKASACWVWMPKNRVIDHGRNNAQIDEDHFGSDGCTDSGEARVQLKDQEDEVFESILSKQKERTSLQGNILLNIVKLNEIALVQIEARLRGGRKHETEFKAITYKRGLDTVEAQLVTYRKNEVLFSEKVIVLKREVGIKQYEINMLKTEFEKLKQEKDAIDFKIEKFDLSYSGLEECQQPKFEGYGLRANKSVCENSSNETKKNYDAPLIEEWVSDNEDEVESPKLSQKPRGNQRNWNNQKSQQLGNDFVMHNKACYVCGSFDHLQYTCKQKRQLNGQREEKPVWNNARRGRNNAQIDEDHFGSGDAQTQGRQECSKDKDKMKGRRISRAEVYSRFLKGPMVQDTQFMSMYDAPTEARWKVEKDTQLLLLGSNACKIPCFNPGVDAPSEDKVRRQKGREDT
ncbi:hypothetical protein Tco_0261506, partial [Tanacetum coccineum]